jgi:uncharacterized protein YjbI with pentapeptide repeats
LVGALLEGCDFTAAERRGARFASAVDSLASEIQRVIHDHERWIQSQGRRGTRAELDGQRLDRLDLRGVDLSGATLRGASLVEAVLARAKLVMADLSGADLHGANLALADLSGANMSYARLAGADLQGARLGPAEILDATGRPTGRRWAVSLRGADLTRTRLPRAGLDASALTDAKLDEVDFEDALPLEAD